MHFRYDAALHQEIVSVDQVISLSRMRMCSKCDAEKTETTCCVELLQPPSFM